MTSYDLSGRRALVTGGAAGIGAGIATALAKAGAAVALADIDAATAQETAARLRDAGAMAAFVPLDVVSDDAWAAAVPAVVEALGGFDILVNNAGIEISALLVDQSAADLLRMCEVNVVGPALGIKHAFRAMRPGGGAGTGGAIVNIASVAATIAFPGIAGYSATKSAVDRITRIAAAESGRFGYGVRVNCLYPGLVPPAMGIKLAVDMVDLGLAATPDEAVAGVVTQTPAGRLGEVGDMAEAALFLCSDAARFITGTGLAVDGGMGS